MRWQSAVIIKATKAYRAVQSRIQYILTDAFKSLYQHQKAYESDIPTDFTSQAKFLSTKQSNTYITRLIAQG